MRTLQTENKRLSSEYEKMSSLRAAYNADKRAFSDKITELDSHLRQKDLERSELEH